MNAEKGINLEECSENNINHNIILDNQYGISTERSNNNNLSNNKISLDESSTILLSYGIYIHISNNNIVSNNNISNCYRGVRIKSSDNSLVFDNSFIKNERGVYCCCSSVNNMIFHNNFIQSHEFHAIDDIVNHWDNGTVGNYWDDYQEKHPDAVAKDGIWNLSYNIYEWVDEELKEPKLDRYPLVDPIDI
jgi:parallel beta-helix repeat protein